MKLMNRQKSNQIDKDILLRLFEYCKYLYEEERERTNRINNAAKTYLAFFTLTTGLGIVKIVGVEELSKILNKSFIHMNSLDCYIKLFGEVMCYLSILLFISSLIFISLVLKVWGFERLCDPKETVLKAANMDDENTLISVIIADYTIATNRNYEINEKKAHLLSRSLFYFVSGLIILTISLFILKDIILIEKGVFL